MILRSQTYLSVVLCVLLFTSKLSASVLKEALEEHLKDVAHDEGAESLKHDKHKGEKAHQDESEIKDSHKNQFSKANDEVKYLKKEHDTKLVEDGDEYGGYNAKQDKIEDTQAGGFKRGHKKGHHNEGFKNSYHKDESSNKSTFFDDFNDEGDQAAYNSRLNKHDNKGGRSYHGANRVGKEYLRDNYHGGGYQRQGDNGLKHAHRQDYGKKYYLDDNLDYNKYHNDRNRYDKGRVHDRYDYHQPPPPPPPLPPVHRDKGWDWQRWDDGRRWERDPGWRRDPGWERDQGWDYGGPGYYDDRGFRHDGGYGHGYGYGESKTAPVKIPNIARAPRPNNVPMQIPKNAPVLSHRKQTITIYEDPRYAGKDKGQLRREEGDYLQLEFKPSNQRYASYDNTYYNAPVREGSSGGVESSKINKLVYNYRRQ